VVEVMGLPVAMEARIAAGEGLLAEEDIGGEEPEVDRTAEMP